MVTGQDVADFLGQGDDTELVALAGQSVKVITAMARAYTRDNGFIPDPADDIAAVLHYRVERATGRPAGSGRTRKPTRLIAGLIPQAHGVIDVEMRAALDEREELIAARADAVLDGALAESVPWTKALGTPPTEPRRAAAWRKSARVIAAYRDRYRVTDDTPLGAPPESAVQKIDAARARATGTDVLELANQLVARRQQIRYPGELRVEAHELAELL